MSYANVTKQLAVAADATAEFTFDNIQLCDAGPPVLTVRHAGSSNTAYVNAALRASSENRGRSYGKATYAKLLQRYEDDARLIADHCVISWRNVVDDDGSPSLLTPDKVFEFLSAILEARGGEDSFLAFRAFCADADNFRAPTGSAAALGKK